MKKFLVLLSVLMLMLTMLAGCAEPDDTTEPDETTDVGDTDTTDQTEPDETNDNDTTTDGDDQTDDVTTASMKVDAEGLAEAMSADGTWIVIALNDITSEEELVLEGEFRNKGDETQDLYRKLAFYAQDADRNITARYTITAPKVTIKSPNTRLQGGTIVGDVYVQAEGFNIVDGKVDGNIYFANDDYMSSFTNEGEVTGNTEVKE